MASQTRVKSSDSQKTSSQTSITRKYIPNDVWKWVSLRTSFGTSIHDCIKGVCKYPNEKGLGLVAPDVEAYDTFDFLFHPVIGDYHKVDVAKLKQINNMGNPNDISELAPEDQKYINSTRARVGRTVKGFAMANKLTREERLALEDKCKRALETLDGDLSGTYKSLTELSSDEIKKLVDDHILYNEGLNKYLVEAGTYRDWPVGRGFFINKTKDFIVWVNEEDHLRLISLQKGASLRRTWTLLTKAVQTLEQKLDFVRHEKFGYLTYCPTNIGTGLRASVHIHVPKLTEKDLHSVCDKLDLQIRGVDGEHSESKDGVYDISNKVRLGKSEFELINVMWTGVKKLIEMNK